MSRGRKLSFLRCCVRLARAAFSLTPGLLPLVNSTPKVAAKLRATLQSPRFVNRLGSGLQVRRSVTCTMLGSHCKCVFEEIGFVRELWAIPSLIVNTKSCQRIVRWL
jgi:hypothetical protein